MRKRILVFPCGSEVGLEIHRSMRYSNHFELVGGSSVDDHGRFVYAQYVSGIPFHQAPGFALSILEIIRQHRIDAIFPTMDAVAETLQAHSATLPCRIIGSSPWATSICASKSATYDLLEAHIPAPRRYRSIEDIAGFPVFIKPDRGYGSRHSGVARNRDEARTLLAATGHPMLILEYLTGREWTVDCFSDRHGQLRFHGVRGRNRIRNGISVNTTPSTEFETEFEHWATIINDHLRPRGAWFFQARQDVAGRPRLLELGARPGGSSALFRGLGVNFALLSAFDAFDLDVEITPNRYPIELDRALENRYRLEIDYSHVYVDLDDCLLIQGRLNHQLVGFLFKAFSEGKHLILLTRHAQSPTETLRRLRLRELFDEVIHITDGSPKSDHIATRNGILVDDSHRERNEVAKRLHIPTFAPDMIECLL